MELDRIFHKSTNRREKKCTVEEKPIQLIFIVCERYIFVNNTSRSIAIASRSPHKIYIK